MFVNSLTNGVDLIEIVSPLDAANKRIRVVEQFDHSGWRHRRGKPIETGDVAKTHGNRIERFRIRMQTLD